MRRPSALGETVGAHGDAAKIAPTGGIHESGFSARDQTQVFDYRDRIPVGCIVLCVPVSALPLPSCRRSLRRARGRPSRPSAPAVSARASPRATNMWRSTAPRRDLTIDEQLSEMQRLQQLRALRSVNELADRCFDLCVTDFAVTKTLRSSESDCLDKCVAKFLIMSQRAGENHAALYGKPVSDLSRAD